MGCYWFGCGSILCGYARGHFLEVYLLGLPRWAAPKALSRLDHTEPLVMLADALAEAIDGGEVFLCILPSRPTLFIV